MSDPRVEAAARVIRRLFDGDPDEILEGWEREWATQIVAAVDEAVATHQRVTHGRHCTCSACAREDWTRAGFAPCGMHGLRCPNEYAPLGPAGSLVPRTTHHSHSEDGA